MGKKGGGSWLTAVKRAFRSPTKDADRKTPEEDEEKKRSEKRRWLFRKPAANLETAPLSTQTQSNISSNIAVSVPESAPPAAPATAVAGAEQNHAIAVAMATAVAAATAQAAVEVARLARASTYAKEECAAVVIQTAFKGYLARRALRALKGLVKLQALVRGHNVRKQAKMTLRCMQALVRVQARMLDQRVRLSHDGSRKSSMLSDANLSVWESRYLQEIADRISLSRDGSSSIADGWDDRAHTIEEVKAMLQSRKEAAFKRDKNNLSQAFSQQQIRRSGRKPSLGNEDEMMEPPPKWLDRWMATKPWESRGGGRASTDQRGGGGGGDPNPNIKTVEIDTSQPFSYLAPPSFRRPSNYHPQYQRSSTSLHSNASPLHRAHHHSPATPSPSKARPIAQVRSASPRCGRDDRNYQSAQTPSLRSNYYYVGSVATGTSAAGVGINGAATANTLPNYMAATESAKARTRSQSPPRQRPATPERERAGSVAKKRLSFPVPDPYGYGGHNLRSPSFKSVISGAGSHNHHRHYVGTEQQSNYSSCCTESLGGEISPSSTSDLRRWLR